MQDTIAVVAGECTTTFDGNRVRAHEQHGKMVVVVKPDNTVLVHDAEGYQPVAWLTRAASVTVTPERIDARDGDQRLVVDIEESASSTRHHASVAGTPVGACPDCEGTLVRDSGAVLCTACGREYSIPTDAVVTDDACDCGWPRMRVERGRTFEVCVDRDCESMDEAIQSAFDREWDCPNCDGDLLMLRRGGLIAGCEHYPDCDTGFSLPRGTVVGTCECGLPQFETASGQRCLDNSCEVDSQTEQDDPRDSPEATT